MSTARSSPRSDFFARLGERALGDGGEFLPRLPSRYEPVAGIAAVLDPEAEPGPDEPSAAAEFERFVHGPRPRGHPLRSARAEETPPPAVGPAAEASGSHDAGVGRAARARRADVAAEEPAPTRRHARDRAPTPPPIQPKVGRRERPAAPSIEGDVESRRPRPERPSENREDDLERSLRRETRRDPEEKRSERSALAPSAERVVLEPSISLYRSSREAAVLERREAELAPTIHVSIGRVEVRAVSPPQPPGARPAASRRRASSLEEYLERRGGSR